MTLGTAATTLLLLVHQTKSTLSKLVIMHAWLNLLGGKLDDVAYFEIVERGRCLYTIIIKSDYFTP